MPVFLCRAVMGVCLGPFYCPYLCFAVRAFLLCTSIVSRSVREVERRLSASCGVGVGACGNTLLVFKKPLKKKCVSTPLLGGQWPVWVAAPCARTCQRA